MIESCATHPAIDNPEVKVTAVDPFTGDEIHTSRRVVSERYKAVIIATGQHDLFYLDSEDVLNSAQHCAATILAGECPFYVAVERERDGQRVSITREQLERTPNLYSLIEG